MALRLFVAVLLGVAVLLPLVAYADTIDPTWQGGFWDDDDFDYVILLVTSFEASLPAVTPIFRPTDRVVGLACTVVADAPLVERRPPFQRRGPPSA